MIAVPDDERLAMITVGEPLISLTNASGRLETAHALTKSVGGAECNVAIGLARLGLRTAVIARVGDDPFGEQVIGTLRGEGVDVSLVDRSPSRPTGLMVKERRSPSRTHVYYYRHGSAAVELGLEPLHRRAWTARHVHLTGITLALGPGPAAAVRELAERAREWGATVSFDPNHRAKLWSVQQAEPAYRQLLPLVDDLLLGVEEAELLTGSTELDQAAERLAKLGPSRVVIRRGAAGAVAWTPDGRFESPVAALEDRVDEVGAGDAFDAGYLFERLSGADIEQALTTAHWAAAQVIGHTGDYEGFPRLAEYTRWRASQAPVLR